MLIEYKPGAGGVIASIELSRSAPNGYTLLVTNTGPIAIAPYLQAKMPYDPVKQFSYSGQVAESAYIVATRTDHPARGATPTCPTYPRWLNKVVPAWKLWASKAW